MIAGGCTWPANNQLMQEYSEKEWGVPLHDDNKLFEFLLLSADLIKRGFKFTGTTICYAFMQTVGMVNDHLVACKQH